MVKSIPGWVEKLLLPSLNRIEGEFKAVHSRMDSLDIKMDQGFKRLEARIDHTNEKIDIGLKAVSDKIDGRFGRLDSKIETQKKEKPTQEEFFRLKIDVEQLHKKVNCNCS